MRRLATAVLLAVLLTAGFAAPASADPPFAAPSEVVSSLIPQDDGSVIVSVDWLYQRHPDDTDTGDLSGFRVRLSRSASSYADVGGGTATFTRGAPDAAADGAHTAVLAASADVAVPDGLLYVWVEACDGYSDSTCGRAAVAPIIFAGAADDADDIDDPADSADVIRDYALENAPVIVAIIGAIFLVGLTFYLIRRGLSRVQGELRL